MLEPASLGGASGTDSQQRLSTSQYEASNVSPLPGCLASDIQNTIIKNNIVFR
jgi:hypothetical protein